MNVALVKIDAASAYLGRSINDILDLVDGGSLVEAGLLWFLTWHTIRLSPGVICASGALNCWRGLVAALTIADACKSIRSSPKFFRHGANISKLAKLINYFKSGPARGRQLTRS